MNIVGQNPGATSASISEDVGNVTLQITAFEDATIRVYIDTTVTSATRKFKTKACPWTVVNLTASHRTTITH